jgi:glutathione S-transferase
MPVIVNKLTGESVSEPVAIAEYLENIYPEDTLRRNGTTITYIDAIRKFSGFYPALYNCITNKDPKKDGPLFKVVIDYIDTIDEMIRSTPGKFLCGIDFNMADLYLTPLLWNAQVSLDIFKQYELMQFDIDPERPALEKYMKYLFGMKEFNDKRVYIHVNKIVYGWKVYRNEAPPPFD